MKSLPWTGVLTVLLSTVLGAPAAGSSAPLELARATACQQAWLPTFGSAPGVGLGSSAHSPRPASAYQRAASRR